MFYIDNMAVYYGWENGRVKSDSTATGILKTVHILAGFLGCHVHVRHVPRMSHYMASLSDELSRRTESKRAEAQEYLMGKRLEIVCKGFLDIISGECDDSLRVHILNRLKKELSLVCKHVLFA